MKLIDDAIREGRTTLSEYESKQVLASYRIPVTIEELVDNAEDLIKAAAKIGYPVIISDGKPVAVDALVVLEGN